LGDQLEQPSNPRPGDDGTGISHGGSHDNDCVVISRGNRAWACGDQGFGGGSSGTMLMDSCWSFLNGQMYGGGHGIKVGWHRYYDKITNSLFVSNKGEGITTNEDYDALGGTTCADSLLAYNNTLYNNDQGVRVDPYPDECSDPSLNELNRVFKNNIVYDNVDGDFVTVHGATYTHEYNSTDDPPGITVTDSDFISLTKDSAMLISILTAPRKADGSLPDIGNYFKLSSTSQLRDVGLSLGYGDDLGAFQYDTETTEPDVVAVTTSNVSNITTTSATVSGEIIHDGGGTVTERGFCWDTSANPTTADDSRVVGTGIGSFSTTITGLTPGKRYFISAYGINEAGTGYGEDVSFSTTSVQTKIRANEKSVISGIKKVIKK